MGRQLDKNEIELGIIDDVVALVVQIAVDIAEHPADALHGENPPEHIDVQNPAELAQGVTFLHGFGEKSAFHPVLNHIGIEACNAGYLTQHNSAGQKHGLKLGFDLLGILPRRGEGGAWDRPVHRSALPFRPVAVCCPPV